MRTMKCPNCSASLTIQDDNRDFAFCEYCGTKLMLDDYRSTHRVVDEAKIRQAETEKIIKLKQMELIEKQQIEKKRNKKTKMIISFGLAIFGFILFLISIISQSIEALGLMPLGFISICAILFVWEPEIKGENQSNNDLMILNDFVRVPDGIMGHKGMSYDMVAKMFENAGFHNIQLVPGML